MRTVVAGAGGQLGVAVVDELTHSGFDVIALTRRDLDVRDPHAVDAITALRPAVVVNCSAWNDVDGAEADPAAALATNARAVLLLAGTAARSDATFVHYSTDFVFDGAASQPYVETTKPVPLNEYGWSKLTGEWCAEAAPQRYVLRLASLFGGQLGDGAGGRSTIDRLIEATLDGREVRAFIDRTVSPSYTADVARATRLLLERRPPPGLYHCVNSGWTTWFELACEIARLLRLPARVRGVSAAEVALRARRPRFCALSNQKLLSAGIPMPPWQDALARHVAARVVAAQTREYATVAWSDGACHAAEDPGSPTTQLSSRDRWS
jgi:dTDP-4-dehydrorhamnose reductase